MSERMRFEAPAGLGREKRVFAMSIATRFASEYIDRPANHPVGYVYTWGTVACWWTPARAVSVRVEVAS